MLQEAFNKVCSQAKQRESHYVSLYCRHSFYGGPEEGGWWGTDVILEATQEFPTKELAQSAKVEIEKLAAKLTADERRSHDRMCLNQMEWLDNRGLEADYLPENDGPDEYKVYIEQTPGEHESYGCRHYE